MSGYKNDIDKMRWSYSRLSSFENCKYEFYLNYIVNDDEQYLREGNFYAEVGSFVHEILAMIFEGRLTLDEASRYYVDNFSKKVIHEIKQSTMDKTFEICADYFANVDFEWLNDYEILGVEMEVKFKLEGYDYIGYIDLLLRDKRDGKIVIVDHKSSEYPFNLDGTVSYKARETFPKYKLQMYLYSHAIIEKYGEQPKEMTWNHFKKNGRLATIPFKKDEYDATLKWFVDTIHNIEAEEDYEPNQKPFYCKNLCNFRFVCEYNK